MGGVSLSIGLFTICLQNNNKNDNYYYLQIEKDVL